MVDGLWWYIALSQAVRSQCCSNVSVNASFCCTAVSTVVDLLAWSPDGDVYIMATDDHIDVCAFEVGFCAQLCYSRIFST